MGSFALWIRRRLFKAYAGRTRPLRQCPVSQQVNDRGGLTVPVRGILAGDYDISGCHVGDPVDLIPEPKNRHDHHAIKVVSARGQKLRYIPAHLAAVMIASDWSAVISAVIPGTAMYLSFSRRGES